MKRTPQDIFTRQKSRSFDERFLGVDGSMRFDIDGPRRDHWRLEIHDGKIKITHRGGRADTIIRSNADDFMAIADGKQNLLTAVMQGRVEVKGDPVLAQQFNAATRAVRTYTDKKNL
jgi:putative sterol carrier protein